MIKEIATIILFLVLSTNFVFSQEVNGIPLYEIYSEYIEVHISRKDLRSSKVVVMIDYGQISQGIKMNNTKLVDKGGALIIFNSRMEALNVISDYGFDFVETYVEEIDGDSQLFFLMKKRIIKE